MTPAIQIQTENRPQPAPVPDEPLLAAEVDGILVLSRA